MVGAIIARHEAQQTLLVLLSRLTLVVTFSGVNTLFILLSEVVFVAAVVFPAGRGAIGGGALGRLVSRKFFG
jgi:hypothetical protein